jgi:protein involved in polysaccharide export with SLBB domain
MKIAQYNVSVSGCSSCSAPWPSASRLRHIRHFGLFFVLIILLAAALEAQQQSNSVSSDCTDSLLANTSQCSGQTSEDTSPLQQQTRSAMPEDRGTQSPNSNYSDTETLSRQTSGRNQPQTARLPLEPLTEFQKFVASTNGQVLPIYGASLFRRVPSTFAPLDMTPVPPDYVIGPGDELRIRVWGQVSIRADVRVDRSGEVYLPQVGPVHVAGLAFSELDGHLRSAIGRVYRNFDLTADVGQIRAIQVYVSGQARRPGVYTVSSLSTLVDALFASGGPSLQGSMRHIELRRGSAVVTDFDLYNLLTNGDKSKDMKLQSGDVIFIPPAGAQVAITGSVRVPAIYELRANESLANLLADAGGVSAIAAEARVSIERIEDHRDRHAMEVAYDTSGLATPLADGDLIRVFSIAPVYRKTVTLRGNTTNPGRFAWHPGMHISDLIPDKESLITRNYWWKRSQLGLPVPEYEPTQGFADLRQPAENNPVTLKPAPQGNMNTLDQPGQQQNQSGQPQDQSGQQQDLPGQQQDQSGSQLSQNPSAQQRAGSASLATQQTALSGRAISPSPRTTVQILAPEIDWNFALIERLDPETLKTNLIPFDLGKLVLQHDASQDLELQPGDAVSIFSEADIRIPLADQTKLVRLDGEFVHAGIYTVQPGETLRHLVERAGGLTPNAYIYASEFTRESTRAVQQLRIDEYVQSLDISIQRGNLAMAAAPASSAQDLASGTAAQSSERELLARLRQIRATGRIVLEFKPEASGTSVIPDIAMENGDHFVIPSTPASVNVVGAVYDQNSFLYASGLHAGAYLQLAGGPNRDADRKHEFIIRANGDVVSHAMAKGLWGSEFDKMRMNPGDTIVVPDKTFKPSAVRGIIDWSSMFSQFALGAAALSIL